MTKNILITGASGLVGTRLTKLLLDQGYQVSHLGRERSSQNHIKSYIWNIKDGFIEEGAIETSNFIVNLAGASVAERWTDSRKRMILDSRLQTTRLLFDKLHSVQHQCEAVISASAIGYYGMDTEDQWLDEEAEPGTGFLANVTQQWEQEITRIEQLNIRVVAFRIGIVLSKLGGALPKIAQTVNANVGAVLGSGEQYMSWIHIDDLCRMIQQAISDRNVNGIYNAVAPNPVTNKEFTTTLAQVLNKTIWMPPVPGFLLKIALGEMAGLVLGGNRVSPAKMESTGFQFNYTELEAALEDILN